MLWRRLRRLGWLPPDFDAAGVKCASGGLRDEIDLFIQGGIDADFPDDGGDAALIAAARRGQENVVRRLLGFAG